MSKKIFVGNLSFQTTESDLDGLFAQIGNVESVSIITDRMTGRSKGFGFVEMSSDLLGYFGRQVLDQWVMIQLFGQGGNDTLSLDEANGALPSANLFGGDGNDILTGGSRPEGVPHA